MLRPYENAPPLRECSAPYENAPPCEVVPSCEVVLFYEIVELLFIGDGLENVEPGRPSRGEGRSDDSKDHGEDDPD
jgi:hypothetical protein